LLKSIHEVLRGGTYVTPKIKKGIEESFVRSTQPKVAEKKLTSRQTEVLQLLAEGKSMKEVGPVLSVTARTVAFHKYSIMEVLNVRSNAELIQFAIRNNLVSTGDPNAPTKIAPTSAAASRISPRLRVGAMRCRAAARRAAPLLRPCGC
jgi:DNA-binding CsgD family transcriptional regulator